MKTIEITKNGLYIGAFQFDPNAGETLKQFCIRVSKTSVNASYELKVSGDFIRTYSNK